MAGPYLERLNPFEPVKGYDYNRIIDALTSTRTGVASVVLADSNAICFGYQPVDSVYKARCRYWVTPNIDTIEKVYLSFTLQPFHVGNQTTAVATTSAATPHIHYFVFGGTTTNDATQNVYVSGSGGSIKVGPGPGAGVPASPGGKKTSTEDAVGSAQASIDTTLEAFGSTGHTHTVPSVNLNPPTAIYEAGMAQGVHVFIDGTDRTTALGGPWGSGSATDISALDITSYITTTGWHEIQLSSTAIGGITVQLHVATLLNHTL